jgi:hypothetical protein
MWAIVLSCGWGGPASEWHEWCLLHATKIACRYTGGPFALVFCCEPEHPTDITEQHPATLRLHCILSFHRVWVGLLNSSRTRNKVIHSSPSSTSVKTLSLNVMESRMESVILSTWRALLTYTVLTKMRLRYVIMRRSMKRYLSNTVLGQFVPEQKGPRTKRPRTKFPGLNVPYRTNVRGQKMWDRAAAGKSGHGAALC